MIIDNASIIAIVLDNAMNIRNAVSPLDRGAVGLSELSFVYKNIGL